MRLLPRDTGFAGLATSLSLAVANYKPIPQLPIAASHNAVVSASESSSSPWRQLPSTSTTADDSSSTPAVNAANQLIPMANQQSFQTQSNGEAKTYSEEHPLDEYGQPSTLWVPVTANSSANQFASKKTVGPGKCAVIDADYTPSGGSDALPAPTYAPFDPVQATVYRYRQQQAVNLGAWFVQEGWMESSFMSCATGAKQSELDMLSGFGTTADGIKNATAYMERHWDTWITEDDFQQLAQMGINTVRLPIGYWSAGPFFAAKNSLFAPYADVYQYSWRYVARAINWAAKYNIGVLVDLHGAYGSQNGQPHSGVANGKIEFYTKANMDLTTALLVWLAEEISDVTNVVGIQLLNEPQDKTSLWPWYTSAMDAMRNASTNANTIPLYFHDAFNLVKGAAFTAKRTDFVVQDYHSYFVYTNSDRAMTAKAHTSAISGGFSTWMQKQSAIGRRNLIVGEWSCALSPSSLTKSSDKTADQTAFCKAQENTYRNAAAGWSFWSYTMENCKNNGGWCFQQAIKSYLPSSFDSWGTASATASYFKSYNVTSRTFMPSLTNKISTLAFNYPSALVAKTYQAATAQADQAGALAAAESQETDADSDASHVNVNGIMAMLQDGDNVNTESAEDEGARIGMVSPSQKQRSFSVRGSGSAAARAGELSRRAAANAQVAAQAGYSDGFKSVRYFAGSGSLSRLGFGTQYRADSYRARVSQGLLQKGALDSYRTQYAAGLLAAEKLVAQTISANA